DEAKRMTNKSVYLKKMVRAYVSNIHCALNDGDFKPLGSDVDTLDGLNIHGALMDEIHQWKHGQALYDIIADGITARDQPFICLTSTSGTIREDFYDSKYDDCSNTISGYDLEDGIKNERLFPFIYELDKRDEWKDPDAWVKANPGLGEIKQLSKLEHKVEQAKIHPEQIKNLLTKEFNIPETSSETWLTMEELVNKETFDIDKLHPRYGIGGVDLASTTDLTCATIIFRVEETEELYVCQMYWMPADLIEKRIEEDRIPYDKWIEKGWMRPSGSDCVDYRDIAKWFQEMQDEHDIYLYAAGYDPWNMNCLIADLKLTFGEGTFREVKQLKKVMSVPMQIMKTQLAGKKINYNNNPILRWCLSNAAIDIDKNNNIQLCKKGSRTKRIDGAASLVDAFVIYQNDFENYMK
ncbi:terminase large subunit, partial [Candidatus Nomurabacteria bacterium]|nr:terminase large subunit [Candidatus Nomurabacteria bacterium]